MGPLNSCPLANCPAYLVPVETPAPPAIGDLVSAVKGETSVIGRVAERRRPPRPRRLYHPDAPTEPLVELVVGITGPTYGPSIDMLKARGFELTVLERAKPKLPTEPGIYADRTGDAWRIFGEGEPLKYLSADGDGGNVDPERWAPFTKLVEAGA